MEPIEGLQNPLCGANSSLTNNVTFTTQSFFITLIFQRNEVGLNFRSKFNLTFLSFAEGTCDSGREDLFSCNNSRCIDKKFTCRYWNACGDYSDCSSKDDNPWDEELVKYFVIGVGVAVGIAVLYVLYKCAKCTKKCIDKCFDCCTDCIDDCECDCSDVDCSCCRNLVGGVLAGCWRLKSIVTSRLESRGSRPEDHETATEQFPYIDRGQGFYIRGLDPPRTPTPYVPSQERRSLVRTSSDTVLQGGSNGLEIYNTPPRARGARAYSDGDGDGLSMPESIDISDDEVNYGLSYSRDHVTDRQHVTDRYNTDRETGNHTEAPPSYHEATAPAPPLETSFPTTTDSSKLPSYDEFLANQTKYGKNS